MEFNLPFSNNCVFIYSPFVYSFFNYYIKIFSARLLTRTKSINKLTRRKISVYIYKIVLKLKFLITVRSHFTLSYCFFCLLKRDLQEVFPFVFGFLLTLFKIPNLIFFLYHFLNIYYVVFLLKMMEDFFPIQNWQDSSVFKQFLREKTVDWTDSLDQYIHSILSWLIVVNIIPVIRYLVEIFYRIHDLPTFPVSYSLDEVLEFMTKVTFST